MRRRFDSSCWLQPLKHCRRCSRLVSGRAGFESAQGHHAALAHSAEHRVGISEVRGSKPRRSTILTYNVPVAQSAEALPSEGRRWGFESSSGHHFARVRKSAKRVGSNPTVWRFDLSREHRFPAIGRSSPTGRGSGLKPRSVQDRGLPAAPVPSPSGWRKASKEGA